MAKVTKLSTKDFCPFCGETPDHKFGWKDGGWVCPRLKSVSVDGTAWQVEFWDPDDGVEITFVPDEEAES